MTQTRKKICLLICSAIAEVKKNDLKDWLRQMPELNIIAEVEPVFVFGENAADVTSEVWLKLATEIKQRYTKFSGFVVFHGIDNLVYTTSALSFLLQNLTKPIIFTSSQPKNFNRQQQGLKANLINAVQVALSNINEVSLMFSNRLLRANQVIQLAEESANMFVATADKNILGRIDFSIRIFEKLLLKNKGKIRAYSELNTNIEIINLWPVLDLHSLNKRIAGRQAVIVNAAAYQDLPQELIFLFDKVTKDLPVIVWSQKITSTVLAPSNIIIVNDMTWASTLTKLMWVLTQEKSIKGIKGLMAKDIAGEIII